MSNGLVSSAAPGGGRPGGGAAPRGAAGAATAPTGAPTGATPAGKTDLVATFKALPRLTRLALGVLAAAAAVGAYAIPAHTEAIARAERDLNQVRGEIGQIRTRATQVKAEYAYVRDNQDRYLTVLDSGLFGDQDRLTAKEGVVALAVEAYLATMSVAFEPERLDGVKANAAATIRSTPVSFRITAMLDQDVMVFLSTLGDRMPGHLTLRSLHLERRALLDAAILKRIADGQAVGVITANAVVDWRVAVIDDPKAKPQPPARSTRP